MSTFPRTVLIETFTAVWCIHCPAESSALFNIDRNTSRSVLDIAELHVCASSTPGDCLENYVTPDGTSDARGAFYSVCGFPDVFFDGQHAVCGATNSMPQMTGWYNSAIANASSIPGNVSISQNTGIMGGNVSGHAFITSGVTGSYNAITYLLEYIGKQNVSNGYGPHDLGWVVRETLFNHPVSLTAGSINEINESGAINSTWNEHNLSVITFVQQNSTKIIQNANMAPLVSLGTAVNASKTTVFSGKTSEISVQVTNYSSGAPVVGAQVNLSVVGGGTISPLTGTTAGNGSVWASYTAPDVTAPQTVEIDAQVTGAGGTFGSGSVSVMVQPLSVPSVPIGLALSPGNGQVSLNWSAPLSGGTGLAYFVFRATSEGGPFAKIGSTALTHYADSGLAGGQAYWYQVSAQDARGFSINTTAVSATGVTATPAGLPATVGWWISIDATNFTSATSAPLPLYLPNGTYSYTFGPDSFAFVSIAASGPITVIGLPITLMAEFAPRLGMLEGTVSPANAAVTVDGTAVPVSGGAFSLNLEAGKYVVDVTSSGFQSNSTSVTLTPGNATTVNIALQPTQPGPGSDNSVGGLSGIETLGIIAAAVGAAAVLGAALLLSKKGKRSPP